MANGIWRFGVTQRATITSSMYSHENPTIPFHCHNYQSLIKQQQLLCSLQSNRFQQDYRGESRIENMFIKVNGKGVLSTNSIYEKTVVLRTQTKRFRVS